MLLNAPSSTLHRSRHFPSTTACDRTFLDHFSIAKESHTTNPMELALVAVVVIASLGAAASRWKANTIKGRVALVHVGQGASNESNPIDDTSDCYAVVNTPRQTSSSLGFFKSPPPNIAMEATI
ncbi:hypothetical protein H310_05901 [Aphanomyces invadans]|uniref:Uncharacterized protein n=1 Tax=Aphanomyces invadans TaxID=157072 RepID=A0A024U843_9STRA|nr:hypothetical protein H310_05901 [Aphanomyces invadans]ETW02375.1 hypothetical protein H310_05901 [Aphanomyces invadans]|eukprot:XP_008868980.1 hypothetical protein H310_05901 [Aphanomyces invadans]